jgi:hypothetical protein
MKTLFILLPLLLLISIQAHPQSQINTEGTLELGYEDRILRFDDGAEHIFKPLWLKQAEFADIYLSANYKRISVYTDVKTYFRYETFYNYDPLQIQFKIGMNYQIGKNNRFLLSAEHMCSHSIECESFYELYDRFSLEINLWYPIQTYAQIKTEGTFELGYEDRVLRFDDGRGNLYQSLWLKQAEFAEIHLDANYKRISAYTDFKFYFRCKTFSNYDPLQIQFKTGLDYQIDKNKRFLLSAELLYSQSIESKTFSELYFYELYGRFSLKINFF